MPVTSGRKWALLQTDSLGPWGLGNLEADHLFADPPFSRHVHANHRSGRNGDRGKTPQSFGFDPRSSSDALALLTASAGVRRWRLIHTELEGFGQWQALAEACGLQYVRSGVWTKPGAAPQFTGDRPGSGTEGIAILHAPGRLRWNGRGKHGKWDHPPARYANRHPCEKPIPLLCELLADFTDPNDLILDPFAGSGSLGLACLQMGRRWIGWERDPRWYHEAARRLIEFDG